MEFVDDQKKGKEKKESYNIVWIYLCLKVKRKDTDC